MSSFDSITPPASTTTTSASLLDPPLQYDNHAQPFKYARASTLRLPHGDIRTPVFMPVGTKGTIKGISSTQLMDPALNPEIILGNTYHLALQPGTETLARAGGLHKFMSWKNNLLTDSGGFQMVSLLDLAVINEEGVKFRSPIDGTEMLLTPEESIRCQNNIGADIMMQLDDVVGADTTDDARFLEAMHRSVRWLDRCIAAHSRPKEQNLFAIIQGGLDVRPGGLRDVCLTEMMKRSDKVPGFAIGGLAGGESKEDFWRVVAYCTNRLPEDKPRYLMGVGYPVDLVVCVALGVDMFDCVYPTRTGRFGVALVESGTMRLKAQEYASDLDPIEVGCQCPTCKTVSRGYLHNMLKEDDALAAQYITLHNVSYMMRLMRSMREAMLEGESAYEKYINNFLSKQFSSSNRMKPSGSAALNAADNEETNVPSWVVDALTYAGIKVDKVK